MQVRCAPEDSQALASLDRMRPPHSPDDTPHLAPRPTPAPPPLPPPPPNPRPQPPPPPPAPRHIGTNNLHAQRSARDTGIWDAGSLALRCTHCAVRQVDVRSQRKRPGSTKACLVARLQLGAPVQQQLRHIPVSSETCVVQRRVAILRFRKGQRVHSQQVCSHSCALQQRGWAYAGALCKCAVSRQRGTYQAGPHPPTALT